MADILHDVRIRAGADRVFEAISTPPGLDTWWTKTAAGVPRLGAEYTLGFGPEYDWRAVVTRLEPVTRFELLMSRADADWTGTRVGFELVPSDGHTVVRFGHRGWPDTNEHYRISCSCWALYLRILRRWLEHGERVAYEERLEV